ncbi:MAG TPA: class I SAM-dependent RNA methyltransferase [Paracoccaceae bacterium]|nr:class I SAM-dependent RNA methyltransferase [Paracoccaceae bacterium]
MRELLIETLGHLGDGVAKLEGAAVHVPLVLPGERVRGEVVAGRIAGAEILVPSPERVLPPCEHYGICGGCALQHASEAFVAGWKADLVRRALGARGITGEVAGVVTWPPGSRRRAVMSGRRLRGGVTVGFHARGSDRLVEIAGCLVLRPEILAGREAVAALTALGSSRKGEVKALVTLSEAGLDIDVREGKPLDAAMRAEAARIAEAFDLARLSWEGEVVAQPRPPVIRLGGVRVVPPPGAFLQATREGEAALVGAVRGILAGAGRVADLFAGCGTFALALAAAAEVHAVEGEAPYLEALDAAWRNALGLHRITTERRDLFRRPLLGSELNRFGAVVLDPPRAGARAQAEALAASQVPVIAYVSCNPATFARDARTLVDGGYRMGPVTVVDQFRWSAQLELVAGFARP